MKNILRILKTMGFVMVLLSVSAYLHAEELSSPKDWSVCSVSAEPMLEITVRGYPDVIHFGDTVYMLCTYKNVGNKVINDVMVNLQHDIEFHQYPFIHNVEVNEIYTSPEGNYPSTGNRAPTPTVPLHPGEIRVMYVYSFELPLLEDINASFWKKLLVDSFDADQKCTLQVPIEPYHRTTVQWQVLPHSISIKPRPVAEMALFDSWMSKSKIENHFFDSPDIKNLIDVGDSKYNPQDFIRGGNRKPPATLCPTTWQDWKELESSLIPSTMRDEIRLTRIYIQYCDTKDKKVLDELKEWFAGMNEVQRAGMARSIYNRSLQFNTMQLLPLYRDIYLAIREHDISCKSDFEIRIMQDLQMLE